MLGKLDIPIDQALTRKPEFNAYLKEIDGRFAIWDLRIDTTDCAVIKSAVGPPTPDLILFSCALIEVVYIWKVLSQQNQWLSWQIQ